MKSKVLLLHGTAPTYGGASRGTYEILTALCNNQRFEAYLCSPGADTPFLSSKIQELGIPHLKLPLNNLGKLVSNVWRLIRFVRANGIDIIHSKHRNADILAFLVASMLKLVCRERLFLVSTLHFAPEALEYDTVPCAQFRQGVHKVVLGKFDRIVAISEYVAKEVGRLFDLPARNVQVIHNGIDIEFFSSGQIERVKNLFAFEQEVNAHIGYIGSLSGFKQPGVLIEVMIRVLSLCPEACFLVVGGGEVEKYRSVLDKRGLLGKVRFLGVQRNIPDWLAFIDIQVFTSKGEAFGRAVAEGMAAGKPCVAFDSGAMPELIVDGKTGYLVELNDVEAMTSRILRLVRDPVLRRELGRNAQRRVGELFPLGSYAERHRELYSGLLDGTLVHRRLDD